MKGLAFKDIRVGQEFYAFDGSSNRFRCIKTQTLSTKPCLLPRDVEAHLVNCIALSDDLRRGQGLQCAENEYCEVD